MLPVIEQSQVAEVRRQAAAAARSLGYDETQTGKASIIATELATNLLKHATSGEVLLNIPAETGMSGFTLMSVDSGPGMENVEKCMRDGYSTAGSSGSGLGAMSRLSSHFNIYSVPAKVTIVTAELDPSALQKQSERFDLAGISVPYPGEVKCGDAWSAKLNDDRCHVVVIDGLGHGMAAAAAARVAVEAFQENDDESPALILESIHVALRSTRGAVGAVARIDLVNREVLYAGVGNIAGAIIGAESNQRLVSHNGTLGLQTRRFQEFRYAFPPGANLILHSDGLTTHWDIRNYPGLIHQDAAMIAGVLYRDERRGRDDATVLVFKERA